MQLQSPRLPAHEPTLRQVFADYVKIRKLKAGTLTDYSKRLAEVSEWLDVPVSSITKSRVLARHHELSNRNGPRGKGEANANLVMRTVRALLEFSIHMYEDEHGQPFLVRNPVKHLSVIRAWNRPKRRTRMIQSHQMPAWWRAVMGLRNGTVRDYLVILILCGLRRNEAATLRWDDVDFGAGTITIRDTKNHLDHVLPLSDYLSALFVRRLQERSHHQQGEHRHIAEDLDNPYVFPGRVPGAPLSNCFKSYELVTERCGVRFSPHDLRRTFLTVAESLDIPQYTLKRLANHKNASDVTAGYLIISPERLRAPMQAITDEILRLAEVSGVGVER